MPKVCVTVFSIPSVVFNTSDFAVSGKCCLGNVVLEKLYWELLLNFCPVLQEAVKGSQGAGRVDDALDSTIEGNEPVAEPVKPKGPARPAGAKGKKKGRR